MYIIIINHVPYGFLGTCVGLPINVFTNLISHLTCQMYLDIITLFKHVLNNFLDHFPINYSHDLNIGIFIEDARTVETCKDGGEVCLW